MTHPLEDLPQFLKDWPYWAAWTAPQKRPLDLRRALAPAQTSPKTNSQFLGTWHVFSYAEAHLRNAAPPSAPYTPPLPLGAGILICRPSPNNRLAFIDFDDLLDPNSEAPTALLEILAKARNLGAYVERSASGTGAHILLRVPDLFAEPGRKWTFIHPSSDQPVGIEVYTQYRFAALTGLPLDSTTGHQHRPELNDPQEGAILYQEIRAFADLNAAPVLSLELPPAPLKVAPPSPEILALAHAALTPAIQAAFDDPEAAYGRWSTFRAHRAQDQSLSAWRFSLFLEAARQDHRSPEPVYELFNPQAEPQHPQIEAWADFSGYSKKQHRRYADIQRAHALVAQEMRLFATDLSAPAVLPATPGQGSEPTVLSPATPSPAHPNVPLEVAPVRGAAPSWAELGLVLKMGKTGPYPLPTSVNIIRLLTRHPAFKSLHIERNLLNGVVTLNRRIFEDTQITRFQEPLRAALGQDSDPSMEVVRAAVEVVADDHAFDPLIEHLEALPPPDPNTHLLSAWLGTIGARKSHDLENFSRRIIIGLIARALDPGVKFDYTPIFEGREGRRKSSLVKALVTSDFYSTMTGHIGTKDSYLSLQGKWGVEVPELAAFKGVDRETVNAFLATDTDSFRPPYGRANRDVKRRVVLFGTTEDSRYLADRKGARRYWPIAFPSNRVIDIDWLLEHRSQIFAEGLQAYRAGERFFDSEADLNHPERQATLQSRLAMPAWQMKIIQHLQSFPHPHAPDTPNDLGFSGVFLSEYITTLQESLKLPQSVQGLVHSQLAMFFKRAGYMPVPLAYRPGAGAAPKRRHFWMHPAVAALVPDEQRAFISLFPDLEMPTSWTFLQDQHLPSALANLELGPELDRMTFSSDEGEE